MSGIVNDHNGGNGLFYKENYKVVEYNNGYKSKEIWYQTDNGDGTYSGKAKEIEYTWNENVLLFYLEKIYCTNDVLYTESKFEYYTNDDNIILKEIY